MLRFIPVLLSLMALPARADPAKFPTGLTWDWQLSEPFNLNLPVQPGAAMAGRSLILMVYDLDARGTFCP